MARHGPVLYLGRALPDRYCIDYSSPRLPSVVVVLARRVIRLLHRWSISSFFRTPQGLDEQALWIVSWDTRIVLSSPCSALSQPDTCCGDHWHRSFSATNSRSGLLMANKQGLGRSVRRHAISSAPVARYRRRPLFLTTSRLIVDGERFKRPAMLRSDSPATRPGIFPRVRPSSAPAGFDAYPTARCRLWLARPQRSSRHACPANGRSR